MSRTEGTGPIRRAAVLVNPAADAGHATQAAGRAVDRLREHGIAVTRLEGADAADSGRLAHEAVAGDIDALIAIGGDGMINLALQALAGSGVALGIVPAGTGNDHARAYGIPLGDPRQAADVIAAGRTRTVDLVEVTGPDGTGRHFGTVLAAGFDSLVTDRANRMTWPRGRMRYNVAMVAELARLRPLPFRLVLDDGTVLERDLTLAAIGNTRSYGGGMAVCPQADPADGLLDVTLVHAMPRRTLVRFFPTVFKGTHIHHQKVETVRTASLRIESAGISAYADGEPMAPLPVELAVRPGALRVIVPG
ncbi:diacylglycerol kinase [Kitasatospora paracochleata]|uniref:Diacylglycerol kinase (ATP) n=1 Tax=Kitasatospora paracochleata TaxID=58354 RepID=A0ABT1IT46_9ACTN|nr:diacylglycerol kinase [Kitasatospora paracochleata]MCP2308254.1 diacylglycerol kinase (ATP) [Kitasatospora paracochleata]